MWLPRGRTRALLQALSHPFLTRDGLQVAPQLAEEAVAPLPSAWVLHPCPHHPTCLSELRTQRNPVKLVSAGTLSGACGCGHRSRGTEPCTVVIQDLPNSVSARSVALERDFRPALAQEHGPFRILFNWMCQLGGVLFCRFGTGLSSCTCTGSVGRGVSRTQARQLSPHLDAGCSPWQLITDAPSRFVCSSM